MSFDLSRKERMDLEPCQDRIPKDVNVGGYSFQFFRGGMDMLFECFCGDKVQSEEILSLHVKGRRVGGAEEGSGCTVIFAMVQDFRKKNKPSSVVVRFGGALDSVRRCKVDMIPIDVRRSKVHMMSVDGIVERRLNKTIDDLNNRLRSCQEELVSVKRCIEEVSVVLSKSKTRN